MLLRDSVGAGRSALPKYSRMAGTLFFRKSLTADWERFMPWRTIAGNEIAAKNTPELEVLLKGIFVKDRFLDLLRHFIVFEFDGDSIIKKMAGYHQFHAVMSAIARTVEAASPAGDRRVGVVWHTGGSGKSLTMAFYAGKIVRHPAMANPTLVVLSECANAHAARTQRLRREAIEYLCCISRSLASESRPGRKSNTLARNTECSIGGCCFYYDSEIQHRRRKVSTTKRSAQHCFHCRRSPPFAIWIKSQGGY